MVNAYINNKHLRQGEIINYQIRKVSSSLFWAYAVQIIIIMIEVILLFLMFYMKISRIWEKQVEKSKNDERHRDQVFTVATALDS